MDMITAGAISGPDILPYDDAHKAVWRCLPAGDRKGLADALSAVALHSADPLILAIVCTALSEFGEQSRAVRLAAACAAKAGAGSRTAEVAAMTAAGRDPFLALPDAGLIGEQRLALSGTVLSILRSGDHESVARALEGMFLRVRPAVDALPAAGYAAGTIIINLFYPPLYLNVGGGPRFFYPFWTNVDLVAPPGAGPRLQFSPETVLPYDTGSLELAYSSHCLEHLDDPTVERILQEIRRVLSPAGRLVLKLPDAEDAIRHWRAGNRAYFDDPAWGLDSVAWSWPDHGVPDTLDSRFCMLLCGYWNAAMTRGGSLAELQRRGAFHGPPRVAPEQLRAIAQQDSPHALAQALRAQALRDDPAAIFNHQNAWSAAELAGLLDRLGFNLRSDDPDDIVARYTSIPDIVKYRPISLYVEAEPGRDPDGSYVTPRAAANASARISERNAAAWEPADLPDIEARKWRRGLMTLHRLLWEYHGNMMQHLRGGQTPSGFLSFGYARGRVAPELLPDLEGIFEGPAFLLEEDDCRVDGIESGLRPSEVEDLRRHLRFFAPDAARRQALEAFLSGIGSAIEAELQTPWHVLNVRCYETALSFRSGPQAWHRDGMPSGIVKILVYLAGPGQQAMGSELIDFEGRHVAVAGESGIWLLFDPSRLVHRGPATGSDRRRIIEVTLCSDLKTDTKYRFGGTNYRHPICPPGIDLFQSGLVIQTVPVLLALQQLAARLGAGQGGGPRETSG